MSPHPQVQDENSALKDVNVGKGSSGSHLTHLTTFPASLGILFLKTLLLTIQIFNLCHSFHSPFFSRRRQLLRKIWVFVLLENKQTSFLWVQMQVFHHFKIITFLGVPYYASTLHFGFITNLGVLYWSGNWWERGFSFYWASVRETNSYLRFFPAPFPYLLQADVRVPPDSGEHSGNSDFS